MATVILPRSLVSLIAGSARTTEVEATTVAEAIDRLDERTPGLRNRLLDSGPTIRQHINVYVDREPAGLDTLVRPDSTIHVIPAVAGG
jgi:molybdopterin converting factor small subunit